MVLFDANVFLDILTDDPKWRPWSEEKFLAAIETDQAAVNPIIYAELGAAYKSAAELERAISGWPVQRLPLPYGAAFPASQAFLRYRREGGQRRLSLARFLHRGSRSGGWTYAPHRRCRALPELLSQGAADRSRLNSA